MIFEVIQGHQKQREILALF